jgi:hypothetical protein
VGVLANPRRRFAYNDALTIAMWANFLMERRRLCFAVQFPDTTGKVAELIEVHGSTLDLVCILAIVFLGGCIVFDELLKIPVFDDVFHGLPPKVVFSLSYGVK